MKSRVKRIIIVGGGLSGLVAGEILSKKFEVLIFEKEGFLGGLAATFEKDNKQIPMFYHHIIKSNKNTLYYLQRFVRPKKLAKNKSCDRS